MVKSENIKRILIILITSLYVLIGQPIVAQIYEPIIPTSQNITFEVCHPIFDGTAEEVYRIEDDTLINDLQYYKIDNYNVEGYFRQDSTNSKAWFKEKDGIEKLIMDLDMRIGDSIFIDCEMYGRRYSKVTRVDTIDSRKVLELDYIYPETYSTPTDTLLYRKLRFIEGIGPSGFFLYQIENSDFHLYGFILREVRKDDQTVYKDFDSCFDLFPVSTNETYQPECNIFPSPSTDFITISTDQPMDKIKIYDLNGYLIHNQSTSSKVEKIDISNLTSGIYIIIINIKDSLIQKKVIKI